MPKLGGNFVLPEDQPDLPPRVMHLSVRLEPRWKGPTTCDRGMLCSSYMTGGLGGTRMLSLTEWLEVGAWL